MSLEAELVTTLRAPVFDGRFYLLVAPAKTPDPYAVYQLVSGIPESAMDGATPNLTNARYQISVFAREYTDLAALVQETKDAMLAATLFKSVCANELDTFEEGALLYGKLIDFSIWHST